jgi:hypothetical protein
MVLPCSKASVAYCLAAESGPAFAPNEDMLRASLSCPMARSDLPLSWFISPERSGSLLRRMGIFFLFREVPPRFENVLWRAKPAAPSFMRGPAPACREPGLCVIFLTKSSGFRLPFIIFSTSGMSSLGGSKLGCPAGGVSGWGSSWVAGESFFSSALSQAISPSLAATRYPSERSLGLSMTMLEESTPASMGRLEGCRGEDAPRSFNPAAASTPPHASMPSRTSGAPDCEAKSPPSNVEGPPKSRARAAAMRPEPKSPGRAMLAPRRTTLPEPRAAPEGPAPEPEYHGAPAPLRSLSFSLSSGISASWESPPGLGEELASLS